MFHWDMSCLIALCIGIFSILVHAALSRYFASRTSERIVTLPAWIPGDAARTVLPKSIVLFLTPLVAALIGVGGVLLSGYHADVVVQVFVTDLLQAAWILAAGWMYNNNRMDWY